MGEGRRLQYYTNAGSYPTVRHCMGANGMTSDFVSPKRVLGKMTKSLHKELFKQLGHGNPNEALIGIRSSCLPELNTIKLPVDCARFGIPARVL